MEPEVLPVEVEALPPMYGQGLHSPADKPHVFPSRHVQFKSVLGSKQVVILVHVPPDPPDDCVAPDCQKSIS